MQKQQKTGQPKDYVYVPKATDTDLEIAPKEGVTNMSLLGTNVPSYTAFWKMPTTADRYVTKVLFKGEDMVPDVTYIAVLAVTTGDAVTKVYVLGIALDKLEKPRIDLSKVYADTQLKTGIRGDSKGFCISLTTKKGRREVNVTTDLSIPENEHIVHCMNPDLICEQALNPKSSAKFLSTVAEQNKLLGGSTRDKSRVLPIATPRRVIELEEQVKKLKKQIADLQAGKRGSNADETPEAANQYQDFSVQTGEILSDETLFATLVAEILTLRLLNHTKEYLLGIGSGIPQAKMNDLKINEDVLFRKILSQYKIVHLFGKIDSRRTTKQQLADYLATLESIKRKKLKA